MSILLLKPEEDVNMKHNRMFFVFSFFCSHSADMNAVMHTTERIPTNKT